MNWWRFSILILAWIPAVAAAQEQTGEDEQIICLSFAIGWTGTLSETRDIFTAPVPASFRERMQSGGCKHLIEASLIEWHIAFGEEAGATAAFDYLQAELLRGLPEPSRYTKALLKAQSDSLRAGRRKTAPTNPKVGPLVRLVSSEYQYQQLAQMALAAAEEFGSIPLLDRTDALIGALRGRIDVLGRPDSGLSKNDRSNLRGHEAQVADLRLRAAVLRAYLTRSTRDIEAADQLLRSAERPIFRAAAEASFSGGEDFCDIRVKYVTDGEAVEKACNEEDDLEFAVNSYWRNRAVLDLARARPLNESYEIALPLIDREERSHDRRCCGFPKPNDAIRLRLMLADWHRRAFADPATGDEGERYQHWQEALEALEDAERLASPSQEPARFRRVAERWLTLWGQSGEARKLIGNDGDVSIMLYRHAAYLRRLLAQLYPIAAGQE